jgi:serine phosphatase RsbU (regulator of sigma subunit)
MQWSLLPPRTFGTDQVLISGALEPAYDIGGDTFDYALNGDVLHVILLDGVGRGLRAATLAAIAVATYRQARRAGRSLEETVRELDSVVAQQSKVAEFVTGWIGELDCATGALRYVNAGHPLPQLLRDGHVVKALECPPTIPLGIGHERLHVAQESLEPGDRILAFTDGVVEGRDGAGGFFGEERLVELLERESASGQDVPEILRRLTLAVLAYQGGTLADDSSMVLLEWRPAAM